jgi:hypothetical protein
MIDQKAGKTEKISLQTWANTTTFQAVSMVYTIRAASRADAPERGASLLTLFPLKLRQHNLVAGCTPFEI